MSILLRHFAPWLLAVGFGLSGVAVAIPKSELPTFEYDATAYYADKDLKKVQEATRLAIKNNWQIRITAPSDWHDKLMAAVKQAAGDKPVKVELTNTIIESVVINLSKPAKKRAKTRRQKARQSQAAPARPRAMASQPGKTAVKQLTASKPTREGVFAENVSSVSMDDVKATIPKITLANNSQPESARTGDKGKVAKKVQPVQSHAMTEGATGEGMAKTQKDTPTANATAAEPVSAREWLRQQFMQGQPLSRELSIEKIRNDDQIMVRDDAYLLVRFSHGRRDAWWLKSPIDTTSVALEKLDTGRYRVKNKIRLIKDSRQKNAQRPQIQTETAIANGDIDNKDIDNERRRLEKLYNKGRKIKKTLLPKNIHKDDIIIVGNGLKLLVRSERDGSLRRYWLEGDVNLQNTDVFRQDSAHKFTALRKYTPKDAR